MHQEASDFCEKAIALINEQEINFKNFLTLDIGGRNVNGSIHSFLPESKITIVDIIDDIGVDYHADFSDKNIVSKLSFNKKFNLAISTEVFEHTPNWRDIIYNMFDSIISGGWILITCATDGRPRHSAIDGHQLSDTEDEYYSNVSKDDFVSYIEMFDMTIHLFEINNNPNDLYALLRKN